MKYLLSVTLVFILASCSTTPVDEASRYKLVNSSVSWTRAKILAEGDGGHLATFSSEEELRLFISTIPESGVYWIGLSDADEEGAWKWIDGTTLLPVMESNLQLGEFPEQRDYAHTTTQGLLGSRADSGVLPVGFGGKRLVDGYVVEFD
jgi:hypothetical protein